MALLNLTAFTPQMAFSVCSTLETLGGTTDVDVLRAWMSPASVYSGGDAPRTLGLGLREAIDLCESVGLINVAGDKVALTDRVGSSSDFRRALREAVLAPGVNADLFDPSPPGGVRAHELTRALTWFMQLRSSRGPFSKANYERFQSDGPRVIANDSRWDVFDRWVVYLGFGWRTAAGLMPDPTQAISDHLDSLFGRKRQLGLPQFLDDLAARIPVLDGGTYHAALLASLDNPRWDNRRVSEPLSLALMRLQRRGVLEFYGGGDAEARVFRIGSDIDSSNQFVKKSVAGKTAA